MDNCCQSGDLDGKLVRILFKISQSLKAVQIKNRFDFDEILSAYKKAVFNSVNNLSETISLDDLCCAELVDFYKLHSLCWVNYIACDSYSNKRKKQVFFSSIFEKITQKAEIYSKKYKELLLQKKPVDIFVQLFFIDRDQLSDCFDILKQDNKDEDNYQDADDLLELFERIQKNGLVIPFDNENQTDYYDITNQMDYPLLLQLGETIEQIDERDIDSIELDEIKDLNPINGIISILRLINPSNKAVTDISLLKKVAQLNRCLHNEVKFLYFVPADGPDGAVGLFCYGAKEILNTEKLDRLKLLAYNILFPFVSAYKSAWEGLNTYREANKSAKAAIMSRNISHNLGSHVMSYLKNHLGSVQNVLNDRVLSRLIEDKSDLNTIVDKKNLEENDLTLPFLVGLGQFISYLQERQDFIATIATDYVPYYATINFKDSIYDVLNNDKRFERHQDRKNLKPDNILLGNIARSEGLGRRTCPTSEENSRLSDIVIKFRSAFTGDPVEVVSASSNMVSTQPIKYYGNEDTVKKAKDELSDMREYDVSLPGGIVGRQAVFSIMENVLRNAAKHGNWRKQGKLELTIDIFSKDDIKNRENDKGLKERLRDDRVNEHSLSLEEVLLKFYCANKDNEDDYFFVTVTDNLDANMESLRTLRKALIEDYIYEDSRMIDANKGIKEMRISAAWLRSINRDVAFSPFNDLNYDKGDRHWLEVGEEWNKKPPVLYARLSKDKEGRCNLQYIFCLMRPKRVALISQSLSDTSTINTLLQVKGWRLFSPDDYQTCKNRSFEIVVLDDYTVTDTKIINQVRLISPKRFIKLSELQNQDLFVKIINPKYDGEQKPFTNEELDKAFVSLYEFLSGWNSKDNEMIYIQDPKAQWNFNRLEDDKRSNKITFERLENARYRYVTHLESKDEFKTYVVDSDSSNCYLFSEGITGDNSTDRLVRNEELGELWFYKHLYAMKQKIAIFDERIFSKVYGLEENDLVIPPIEGFGSDLSADKEAMKKIFKADSDRQIIDSLISHELLKYFVEKKIEIIEGKKHDNKYDPRIGYDLNAIDALNHRGATYAFKGLYIFTIIRSIEQQNAFNIYGYQYAPEASAFSRCVKYATISWDNDFIIQRDENVDWMYFDSLSIHQGLLDKLYGVFGIKTNKKAKENLTKRFYDEFLINLSKHLSKDGQDCVMIEFPIEFKERSLDIMNHYFLPGMTIHSGRSKPSKEDMPQWIPFIPYSAIENAVHDCKYSIVELLDSARYERE